MCWETALFYKIAVVFEDRIDQIITETFNITDELHTPLK